jgi:hypothetical protein
MRGARTGQFSNDEKARENPGSIRTEVLHSARHLAGGRERADFFVSLGAIAEVRLYKIEHPNEKE